MTNQDDAAAKALGLNPNPTQAPTPADPAPGTGEAAGGQVEEEGDEEDLDERDDGDPTATRCKAHVTISSEQTIELNANDYEGLDVHCTPQELLAAAQRAIKDGDFEFVLEDILPENITLTSAGFNMPASGVTHNR